MLLMGSRKTRSPHSTPTLLFHPLPHDASPAFPASYGDPHLHAILLHCGHRCCFLAVIDIEPMLLRSTLTLLIEPAEIHLIITKLAKTKWVLRLSLPSLSSLIDQAHASS